MIFSQIHRCWDDFDPRVYVLLSVLGEDTSFLFGQQNILLKNSVTGKVTGIDEIWYPSSNICPACQVEIELTCYYKREDKPDVWKFAFQSIARVCQLKRATTFVWLTREKKVTWSSCCIQNLGKFKEPIFVVWGIQSSRYCTEMNYRTKNELHWACTAKGAYKCENDNLAVTAGPPFFRFL